MLPKTLLLGAFLPSALAVSLADFAPRASNLPSACQSVYTSSITMCQPSDFEQKKCSENCVNALNALRTSVNKACKGISGHNILAAMMAGRGTQDLCPNAGDYDNDSDHQPTSTYAAAPAPSSTTTQAPPPQSTTTTSQPPPPSSTTSTSAPATTSASESSSSSSERTTVVFATNTVVPQPSGTEVPTSIVFDSNTPSDVAATASRTSSQGAAATSVRDSGSPFGGSEPGMEALSGSGSTIRTEAVALALAAVVAVMMRL